MALILAPAHARTGLASSALLLALSACVQVSEAHGESAEESRARAATPEDEPELEPASGEGEPEPEPEPESEAEPEPLEVEIEVEVGGTGSSDPVPVSAEAEVEVEAQAAPTLDSRMVPRQAIETAARTVSWRELETPAINDLDWLYLARGALGRSPQGFVERDDAGALRLLPELELPEGELQGSWPKAAWVVESRTRTLVEGGRETLVVEHRLFGYDGWKAQAKADWRPRTHRGEQWWALDEGSVRVGWDSGVLVREGSRIYRLGSVVPNPKVGQRMGKRVLDVFETAGGELYNVSQRPDGVYVQVHCSGWPCVEAKARKLPEGERWRFGIQVPRQRHSATMAASVDVDGVAAHHLLHFEAGGWKLESLVREPRGLWSGVEGGLWMVTGQELWFRDSRGAWFVVEGPEEAAEVRGFSVAMTADGRELLLATKVADTLRVFATAAEPSPSPGPSDG